MYIHVRSVALLSDLMILATSENPYLRSEQFRHVYDGIIKSLLANDRFHKRCETRVPFRISPPSSRVSLIAWPNK
jgi:hypothetical protein